jgi:hypothetical protein
MQRRDVLIGIGGAAALGGASVTPAAANAAAVPDIGPYATPWNPPDTQIAGRMNIAMSPDDFFVPGRFAGKTVIVTGCARGMGRGAAIRLAREGANIVGVDWLDAEGAAVIAEIVAEGHAARFVAGDVAEDETCARMVAVAVDAFGGLDAALNNAGVMDGAWSGDPIDYAAQKDLVFAPIHEATEAYWDNVFRTNVKGTFFSMRHELRQMIAQGRGGGDPQRGLDCGLDRACRQPGLCRIQTRRERHDTQCGR